MPTYRTRDMVSMRHMHYNNADLKPGDAFTALSDVDADYMVSRGRASKASEGRPVAAPVPAFSPQQSPPDAGQRRAPGRPSNAQRLADQEAAAQSEHKASEVTPHN